MTVWTEKAAGGSPLVVLTANSAWNIVNFRGHLVGRLVEAGYRVAVVAGDEKFGDRVKDLGAEFIPIDIDSSGLSPIGDARLLLAYWKILRRLRPVAMLGFTAKPNIYASLAARLTGTKAINNVSGLGTAFIRAGLLQTLVTLLYRVGLARSHIVFFQNPDDRDLFVGRRLVRAHQARLLPGSGVDLDHFAYVSPPSGSDPVRFLFIGRLMWDKGIAELVAAARIVRAVRPRTRIQLLGFIGIDNRTAVPRDEVEAWVGEGVVDYLGETDDVRPAIAAADCVVLPSYREGLPRSLLEASAIGRPAIASDVPGCREVIEHGRTGLLCEVRSPAALADAMLAMIDLSPEQRKKMGRLAREKAEREFDQRRVASAYFDALARSTE